MPINKTVATVFAASSLMTVAEFTGLRSYGWNKVFPDPQGDREFLERHYQAAVQGQVEGELETIFKHHSQGTIEALTARQSVTIDGAKAMQFAQQELEDEHWSSSWLLGGIYALFAISAFKNLKFDPRVRTVRTHHQEQRPSQVRDEGPVIDV